MSLQSMTGYASAQTTLEIANNPSGARLGLEIRSVNSRFLDISFRLPDEMRQHEPALRELLGQHIKRGKVELRAHLELTQSTAVAMPDKRLLQSLVEVQQLVRNTLHDAPLLSVAEVIRLSHGALTPSQDWSAQVSWVSPIAQALLKSHVGDVVKLQTPKGLLEIEVLKVTYPSPN